ncbi:hypothetical protein HDV03_003902 [Kappamyces sp. JEL0829]|nr:hypothetical protein HDV03_003902 [Kappamyces sp. JEL0829]
MQTTAVIYTAVPPLPGTSRKHKSNTKATSKSDKHEREASLVELFETAKSQYRPGKHEESEEGLRSILKTAVPKPDGPQDGGPGGEKKPTSTRIIRPKSARPTRNSAFPVASAFSEAGSDGESDINDYEVDGLVDGETAQEVVATSTIVGPAAKPSQKPAKSKPSPKGAAASDQNHAGHGKGSKPLASPPKKAAGLAKPKADASSRQIQPAPSNQIPAKSSGAQDPHGSKSSLSKSLELATQVYDGASPDASNGNQKLRNSSRSNANGASTRLAKATSKSALDQDKAGPGDSTTLTKQRSAEISPVLLPTVDSHRVASVADTAHTEPLTSAEPSTSHNPLHSDSSLSHAADAPKKSEGVIGSFKNLFFKKSSDSIAKDTATGEKPQSLLGQANATDSESPAVVQIKAASSNKNLNTPPDIVADSRDNAHSSTDSNPASTSLTAGAPLVLTNSQSEMIEHIIKQAQQEESKSATVSKTPYNPFAPPSNENQMGPPPKKANREKSQKIQEAALAPNGASASKTDSSHHALSGIAGTAPTAHPASPETQTDQVDVPAVVTIGITPLEPGHNAQPESGALNKHSANELKDPLHELKDRTKVLQLNDSTVGRTISMRGSIGKKVMRGIEEGNDAGEVGALVVPRPTAKRTGSKRTDGESLPGPSDLVSGTPDTTAGHL